MERPGVEVGGGRGGGGLTMHQLTLKELWLGSCGTERLGALRQSRADYCSGGFGGGCVYAIINLGTALFAWD